MRLTARHRPAALAWPLLGSLAFMAVGAGFIVLEPTRWDSVAMGLFAIVAFGLFGAVFLRRIADRREVLVIDAQGLFDRRAVDRPVPWGAIAEIEEGELFGQPVLAVRLRRPIDEFIDDRRKLWLAGTHQALGADLFVTAKGLTVELEQIRTALRAAWTGDGQRID